MLTGVLAVILFLALALHLLLVEQPRRKARMVTPALPEPLPLEDAVAALPDGAFLQPTFTWAHLQENGDLLVGVHPLIVSLVGSPYKLEVIPEGWEVRKGMPLLKIRRGRRRLQLFSPVNGRIAEVNPNACMEKGWTQRVAGDDCWVYRIEPVNASVELPLWFLGDQANSWVQSRFVEVKEYLTGVLEGGSADTEDPSETIRVGILAEADREAWSGFQERFLNADQDTRPSQGWRLTRRQ